MDARQQAQLMRDQAKWDAMKAMGEQEARAARSTATERGYVPAVPWSGAPTGSMYPEAWGGPLPEGHYAVRVIAHGGVSNLVLAEPC
jgi:hypothetical protein